MKSKEIMMQATISEKPTLVQLLNRHRVNMIRLARFAHVHVAVVRCIARNVPVQQIQAEQVLDGLYRLTGVCYLLKDVDIALIPPSYVPGGAQFAWEEPLRWYAAIRNVKSEQ